MTVVPAQVGGASKSGMNVLALATDFDGTIAHDGLVENATISACEDLLIQGGD
jgi:hypothetical protein